MGHRLVSRWFIRQGPVVLLSQPVPLLFRLFVGKFFVDPFQEEREANRDHDEPASNCKIFCGQSENHLSRISVARMYIS